MSEKNNPLELYVAEKLKDVDPHARPTAGSGCGNEIGDVSNKFFFVECKQKHTKTNIIMDYMKDYHRLLCQLPVNTDKEVFVAIENKYGEKFVVMEADAFFRLVNKGYENEE